MKPLFGVMFELPERPGYFTEPEGRYGTRAEAKRYLGKRAGNVLIVFDARRKKGRTYRTVIAEAIALLEQLESS